MKKLFSLLKTFGLLLVPGLTLVPIDQVLIIHRYHNTMPLGFILLYLIILLPLALIGWGLLAVLVRRSGHDAALKTIAAAAAAVAFIALVLTVGEAVTGASRGLIKIVLAGGWFGLTACVFIMVRREETNNLSWLAAAGALVIICNGWCVLSPSRGLLGVGIHTVLECLVLITMFAILAAIPARAERAGKIMYILAPILIVLNLAFAPVRSILQSKPTPAQASARTGDARPNIILIVWDTVRRDHLSLYGYERTTSPHLDAFAKQSLVYTNAKAVAPWTLPSHASMFTGLYPETHGAYSVSPLDPEDKAMGHRNLREEETTLAEVLARNGYRCGAVSANLPYAGPRVNLDQGFEFFDSKLNGRGFYVSHFDLFVSLVQILKTHAPDSLIFPYLIVFPPADQVNRRALEWVDTASQTEGPFFLFLNYMDAHGPSYANEELMKLFPGFQHDLLFLRSGENSAKKTTDPAEIERRRQHLISQYDAEIVFMDQQFQKLLDELELRGLQGQTIVILTSDHGDMFGERNGLLGHRYDLYSELLDIPLIIHYPDNEHAGVEPGLIENRELFFMVQRMAGLSPQEPSYPWQAFAQQFEKNPATSGPRTDGKAPFKRAFFYDQYKLILHSNAEPDLFDRARDPGDLHDVAADNPDVIQQGLELNLQFDHLVKPFHDGQSGSEYLSPEDRERLRALGYIK